ncbi:hypothetical protein D4740_03135 [Actinomyces sp. 2119]|uniref:hypothetical protein n=1 Tax=Actinomyces sp. 2119 TaxID=2321393 RepID=UPI000E6CFD8A|nr:hypothetical protein [Actinomyces sp. 2119]RJF43955.1 hypothetical protein D4740_03135 [Actinomyces sp. 2119]
MSEFPAGSRGRHVDASRAVDGPARPADASRPGADPAPRPQDPSAEHVRFGVPFNGVLPVWHDDATISWHRPVDGTDLAGVLGLGLVETEPGPASTPPGWVEHVETGTLTHGGRLLHLRAASPSGRRAVNNPGSGMPVALGEPLSVEQAMEGDFDLVGFGIHVGRCMLRAARDGGILVFALRAPRDPEPHHLLSVPAEADDHAVMTFHLGTLLDMEGGAWEKATRSGEMTLLDLTVPYADLVADLGQAGRGGGGGEEGLDADKVLEMAQPAVQCLLKPGFPFALGASILLPEE